MSWLEVTYKIQEAYRSTTFLLRWTFKTDTGTPYLCHNKLFYRRELCTVVNQNNVKHVSFRIQKPEGQGYYTKGKKWCNFAITWYKCNSSSEPKGLFAFMPQVFLLKVKVTVWHLSLSVLSINLLCIRWFWSKCKF